MKKRFTDFFKLGFEKRKGFLLCKSIFYLICITSVSFAKSSPNSLGSVKIIDSYLGEYVQNQDIPIKGTVRDDMGEPLLGVSVIVKGTKIGAVTDANGNFSLSVPSTSSVLVFSFTGLEMLLQMVHLVFQELA